MVKSALRTKFYRGLKNNLVQLLSITITLALGVGVFIGLDSTWRSLEEYIEDRYQTSNIADIELYTNIVPKHSFDSLLEHSEINGHQELLSFTAELVNKQGAELEVNGFADSLTISQYDIVEGTEPLHTDEVILDKTFAEANNISLNDELTLSYNGVTKAVIVKALAVSSSYIYTTPDSTTVVPNHEKFGFLYTDISTLTTFTNGQTVVNKVLIDVDHNQDIDSVKQIIENEYKDIIIGNFSREETLNDLATQQKITQYQSIGNLFPFVFFAVVILMTFSTMIRLITNERKQIGILKALGFSELRIILHYLSYGISVSVIGVVTGILLGWRIVPVFIWRFFEELFVLEEASIVLSQTKIIIISVISLLSTVIAILIICLRNEKEAPANLLRNKVDTKGNHIFLERFPYLWNRNSVTKKLLFRQTLKNKIRLFMTVIGVAGCSALLIASLGIRDTVNGVAANVYGENYTYAQKIYIAPQSIDDDFYTILQSKDGERIEERNLSVQSATKRKMGTLHVLENSSDLIHFYDNDNKVSLDNNELLITEKTAQIYNLTIGDQVSIKTIFDDELDMKVSNIVKMNIGQGFYINEYTWTEIHQQELIPTAFITKDDSLEIPENYVLKSIKTQTQESDFMESMNSTLSISIMMILAAALLALLVLYNLGILNFAERERDLATLSVLGFYYHELRYLLVLENIFLSILGILIGIPGGLLLHERIFSNAGMGDELDFSIIINLASVVIAFLFTFGIVIVVNIIMSKKIKRIKMTEALKSIE
ncbi:putative ABC transport system permease protein [Natronobacillus azotifigens]|uniref:FtsX-like permease family protein n=1 Tax=Natronobacillus azotifigens TaxID=472978 RepID=A0A9J6RAE4_9BACI|nr:ABC transporter permease [Natronobacillus azotifigens]MCZ0702276.1 FtsX-like permease family protein [Natronobacillus azotifigens]